MKTVKFMGEKCAVKFDRYLTNDRIAIRLLCLDENGSIAEPMAVATVNIPEYPVPDNHVLIKDWSENAGMLQCLAEAGIVEDTGVSVPTGFVEANLCKLLVEPE